MRCSLTEVLPPARAAGRAVACFNVFGLDEAVQVVAAAETCQVPVILGCNKDLVASIPVEVLGASLSSLAERANVAVCVHLDHTYDVQIAFRAIRGGFTSIMIDGSQLPYQQNVALTCRAVEVAHACGVSVEGEIGSVSYNEPGSTIRHELTEPETAARFVKDTDVDVVAVSVGTVHKLESERAEIDHERLRRIAELVDVPIAIHGTSGVPDSDLRRMAAGVATKFNVGTLLRKAWGTTLREQFREHPKAFDRLTLTRSSLKAVREKAEQMMLLLANPNPVVKKASDQEDV